jgi:hypothetical protein
MPLKRDLLIAPIGEGALIMVLAAIGWATRWPFIFASLGPTAYEMMEQPELKSARPYNVIAGHFVALGAGWASLWVFHARASPTVSIAGFVSAPRLWAAVLAVVLTTLVTLTIRASQPAALSTALLVSLGSMQTARSAAAIVISVLILAAIGEPLRRWRVKAGRRHQLAKG